MSKSQIRFSDYRYYKPRTHYSPKVALKVDVNHDTETIIFAFAICSWEDNFSRQVAREILDERMNSGKCLLGGQFNRDRTLLQNCMDIVNHFVDSWSQVHSKEDEDYAEARQCYYRVVQLRHAFVEIGINIEMEKFESKFMSMELMRENTNHAIT